jgi:hypothetical protein
MGYRIWKMGGRCAGGAEDALVAQEIGIGDGNQARGKEALQNGGFRIKD